MLCRGCSPPCQTIVRLTELAHLPQVNPFGKSISVSGHGEATGLFPARKGVVERLEVLSDATGCGCEGGDLSPAGSSFSQQHPKSEDLSSSSSTPRSRILRPTTEEICRPSRPDPNPDSGSGHTEEPLPLPPFFVS